ncbi:MAG: isochorismatase family protein [Gemmatimonas sp.]
MDRPFDRHLSTQDREVLRTYGYGNCAGAQNRPAVLVVDVNYTFVGENREPVTEAIKRRRNACGTAAWDAVDALRPLLDAARAKGLPVFYTTGDTRPDLQKLGAPPLKTSSPPATAPARNLRDGNEIVEEIAPKPGDIVLRKTKPSAFFGTPLISQLVALRVDSLFVTGGATSGCVRASAVDAFSNNYPTTLVADCCFDRFEASHAMTLFDLGAKYVEIASSAEAIARIEALPDGLFGGPR